MIKVLCCGDRNWTSWKRIEEVLAILPRDTVIIEGEARGADKMCRYVAERQGLEVRKYPADWAKHGKAAGPIRNREQYDKEQPDWVFAFHNDLASSKGTKDMCEYAFAKGCKRITVYTEEGESDYAKLRGTYRRAPVGPDAIRQL